jgi:putative ABC transport system ATP-binding protein
VAGVPVPALADPPPADPSSGVAVKMAGVVHLYHQAGVDVVGLRSVDLDVEPGEMVALLGPSGMGKTTVLRLMAGLMTASAGSVRVDDRDLGQLRLVERRKLLANEISYVVQDTMANMLPFATVAENLWFAQHGAKARGHVPRWTPEWLLEYLGLSSLAGARVATLPMGIQQQVAIASGVAAGPRLLLADEPTGQLTAVATAEVIGLLHRVNASGTTVVIVTHDISIAGRFPRAVTIRDGRVGAEVRQGEVYGVIDRGGTVQLPPDVLERLRPNSRIRIVHTETGVELREPDPDRDPGRYREREGRRGQPGGDKPVQSSAHDPGASR